MSDVGEVVIKTAPSSADPGTGEGPAGAGGDEERGEWGSKLGFIFAAIGSAIGFGSLARFPFVTADNGGAAFVLIYAGIMLVVGVPMMMAEFAIGRASRRNPVGAFAKLRDKAKSKWRAAGFFYLALTVWLLSWYAVTVGWVLRYVFSSTTGSYFADPTTYFANIQEGPAALLFTVIVAVLTFLVVGRGIEGGIEKLNLVMIPSIFVILVGLTIYAATLDGVGAGYEFYLSPDWGEVSAGTIKAAVAQAFFSLSLGSGAMLVYASYIGKQENLASNALTISVSTLGFAFLAGLLVFPLLAGFDLLGSAQPGIGLIFGPLPAAFASLGAPLGQVVGTTFFVATFFAAFTSAVALLEPSVSYLCDEFEIPRRKATFLMAEIVIGLAILPSLSTRFLNLEAGSGTDVLILLGGVLVALFIGLHMKDRAREEMDAGEGRLFIGRWVNPVVRYAMPVLLGVLTLVALFGNPEILGLEASEGFVHELAAWFANT
ncbi:MAG: sodium-dependent transporter [Candidatus Thermoplasmatota archaeon]|nr:sodium-dependent transporter [Candidatus Thermoplasmatota archaeon]